MACPSCNRPMRSVEERRGPVYYLHEFCPYCDIWIMDDEGGI